MKEGENSNPANSDQWSFGGYWDYHFVYGLQYEYPSASSFGIFVPRILHHGAGLSKPGVGST